MSRVERRRRMKKKKNKVLKAASGRVSIGIDVGGTFTDIIFYDNERGETRVSKVPTSSNSIDEAIIQVLQEDPTGANPRDVRIIKHATTVATNSLITHAGLGKIALVTNKGFRDVLEIGRQRRPELYNISTRRPVPLVSRRDRFTISGRMLYNGQELEPINTPEIIRLSRKLGGGGGSYDCVVVGLLNSYANPEHEKIVAEILSKKLDGRVITSSSVNNEYREYERISTAVVNAALTPIVSSYLNRLVRKLRGLGYSAPLYLMNSDGSVSTFEHAARFPISIIESGPAAGVLACVDLARNLSEERVLTFDMGGTTAKAGIVTDYQPEISEEFEAAGSTHSGRSIKGSGYPVRHSFIDLAEVSAGGGTIAWVDEGGALRLGPHSAGAIPGPAAYGRGGLLPTVTDANVITGRLSPDYLLGGKMAVKPDLALKAVTEHVAKKLGGASAKEASKDIIRVVNHNMARAISIVSVERGHDPRLYLLIAFGGAGPLHACDLAEGMGISSVVVPLHPGLFSAYGLLTTADLARVFSAPLMTTELDTLEATFEKLMEECARALSKEEDEEEEQCFGEEFITQESVDLRYEGQSYELNLPFRPPEKLRERFDARHRELYGYSSSESRIEAVNAKIRAVVKVPKIERRRKEISTSSDSARRPSESKSRLAWISGEEVQVSVFTREKLIPGNFGTGPCVIEEYDSTTVVNTGWSWKVDEFEDLHLQKEREREKGKGKGIH